MTAPTTNKAPNSAAPAANTSTSGTTNGQAGTELSNAEKKKLAKAEKAAKRAAQKDVSVESSSSTAAASNPRASSSGNPAQQRDRRLSHSAPKPQHKRAGSTGAKDAKQVAIRTKPTSAAGHDTGISQRKQVAIFEHLYGQSRRRTLAGTPRDVHPAIQALGMQISHYQICGSHARCVAMMLSLKAVIQDYKTPHGTSLPRDLSSHHLSPQLAFIKSCRPFSVSQSNAIRWLKNIIANIDPSTPEPTAKNEICTSIDSFINERLTIADKVIADATIQIIEEGDVILTFAKSAVVTSSLISAAKAGRKFRVIVLDSRPLHEGRSLARCLADNGVDVSYYMLTGLAHAVATATKCIIGAHALLGDGSLYSRAGSAAVALAANEQRIPVFVCAESIKFTERVALDSVVMNELAPEEELVYSDTTDTAKKEAVEKIWKERDRLQLLNLMFDVTPADYISMVITELGNVPPGSAPVIQRISGGAGEVLF